MRRVSSDIPFSRRRSDGILVCGMCGECMHTAALLHRCDRIASDDTIHISICRRLPLVRTMDWDVRSGIGE